MQLEVITPIGTLLKEPVIRIVAEAPGGSFGILPRHADFVSLLAPSILTYETEAGSERYVGINSGTLVKCGDEVLVSVLSAVTSDRLEELGQRVAREFHVLMDEEREARSALARLEAGMARRFLELERKRG